MSDVKEGKQGVEGTEPQVPPSEPEGDKGHPENVPWSQYVGIKEKFTRVETEDKNKIASLEEQLKGTTSADEVNRIKAELESAKTAGQKAVDDLKASQTKTLTEKRDSLVKKGVPVEKVTDMSVEQLDAVEAALGQYNPKPDLGGGSGGGELKGSPMELAKRAYTK